MARATGQPMIGVFAALDGAADLVSGSVELEAALGRNRKLMLDLSRLTSKGGGGETPDGRQFAASRIPAPGLDGDRYIVILFDDVAADLGTMAAVLRDGAALAAVALGGREGAAARAARLAEAEIADEPAAILPRDVALRLIEETRAAGGGRAALLLLDLDRFRAINDALGMEAGDAFLAVTAERLRDILGRSERMLRLEGDRFVIVTHRHGGELQEFAQRALEAVGAPAKVGGQSVSVQACVGVVAAAPAAVPTAIVLLQADTALKRAKNEGRNRFVVHEPEFDAAILEKSQLELELSHAPKNGQMHLVYQPYIDLETGVMSGAEALLRWRHPSRGEIMPNTFIPIAESTGLILPLGNWAMRRACAEARDWPLHLFLSVNISALQFHQPTFTAQVDAALAESGFPAERLELEITETVLMRDNPETIAQIEALIDRGVRIALDDFGTGYSALAYLARLPHHRIKLDRSFVRDLNNPATAELIRAIISTARNNGVSVTAEGVERPEQIAQVRAAGFTHAQGYAMSRPARSPIEQTAAGEPAIA